MIKYMLKITHVSLNTQLSADCTKGGNYTAYMEIILNVNPMHAFLSRANVGM